MLALEQGLVQVSFHLQVRRADLVVMSMRQLDILMNNMAVMQNHIIEQGYLVKAQLTLDGVMISTNT